MGIFIHAGQVIFTRNGSIGTCVAFSSFLQNSFFFSSPGASFFIYNKNLIPYLTMAYGSRVFVNFGDIPFTNDITVFSTKLRERTSFSKLIDYFWTVEIKAYQFLLLTLICSTNLCSIIEERYTMALTKEERSASLSLMQTIDLPELIQRFEGIASLRAFILFFLFAFLIR
jgi:hypothetical protein